MLVTILLKESIAPNLTFDWSAFNVPKYQEFSEAISKQAEEDELVDIEELEESKNHQIESMIKHYNTVSMIKDNFSQMKTVTGSKMKILIKRQEMEMKLEESKS